MINSSACLFSLCASLSVVQINGQVEAQSDIKYSAEIIFLIEYVCMLFTCKLKHDFDPMYIQPLYSIHCRPIAKTSTIHNCFVVVIHFAVNITYTHIFNALSVVNNKHSKSFNIPFIVAYSKLLFIS